MNKIEEISLHLIEVPRIFNTLKRALAIIVDTNLPLFRQPLRYTSDKWIQQQILQAILGISKMTQEVNIRVPQSGCEASKRCL